MVGESSGGKIVTIVLVVLLALNAVLHGAIVVRFGAQQNMPPLVFGVIYAVLAVLVALAVPYALWGVLLLTVVGLAGLAVNYNSIAHDRSVERVIFVVGGLIVLSAAYLLFLA